MTAAGATTACTPGVGSGLGPTYDLPTDKEPAKCGWATSFRKRFTTQPAQQQMWDMQHLARQLVGGVQKIKMELDYAGGWQVELASQYGTPVEYDYSVECGRRDTGNYHFHGATKWSNNVAELTAMIQAMLEVEALVEPPDQVWMFYDSTYASNALARATPPIHRDSPNTALGGLTNDQACC